MQFNVREFESSDKNVKKYVFTKPDVVAEAVLYKYPTYRDRTVICCSTQSGCPVGCRFCGAGDSFVRSLTSEEIIDQVQHLVKKTGLSGTKIENFQVMFMSMGEPLLNLRALDEAICVMASMWPHAKMLISTSAPRVDYEPLRDLSRWVETVGLPRS